MKTESVLQRLALEAENPKSNADLQLKKADAILVLNRIKDLEGVAAALLRSQMNAAEKVVLPYKAKPTK